MSDMVTLPRETVEDALRDFQAAADFIEPKECPAGGYPRTQHLRAKIDALRAALDAQPKQTPPRYGPPGGGAHNEGYACVPKDHHDDIVASLSARLAAAEREMDEATRRSAIDQRQCDEMTEHAGKLAEQVRALEEGLRHMVYSSDGRGVCSECDAAAALLGGKGGEDA